MRPESDRAGVPVTQRARWRLLRGIALPSVAEQPDIDDGVIHEGSLTLGGNMVGPKAWHLIVALNQYDDWMGAVLDVVDEAVALAQSPQRPRLESRR